MKLSVIIPAYNEQDTILEIIRQVRDCGVEDLEMVIVNDCSSDGTRQKLESLPPADDLVIVHHERNRGKGAAIQTAQQRISGDVVVIQDADLEYSPSQFPRLLKPIELLVDSFWHYVGNYVLTTLSNIFSNIHITDMETCYKMIRAEIFKGLTLECSRFGFEPEITAKLARRKCRIYEVPISYEARRFDEGKKIGWRDGVAAIWYIIKYNLFDNS
jgi:glycosyltransferase involved in cell wall biosynthesis